MHKGVLVEEALEYLGCEEKKVILDCTVGGAGHAKEILKRLPPGGRLVGIDADEKALKAAEENLKSFKGAFSLAHENFRNLDSVLRRLKIDGVDGMLFDLGISSFQLEDAERGFSFSRKGALDMRMDASRGKPLCQILNSLDEDSIGRIIRDYGQERFWRKIARAIVSERKKAPIENSLELAGLIRRIVRFSRGSRIDPCTRSFQGLRIFVNDELAALEEALGKAPSFLKQDARIVVISFHSLEDRIVKHKFKELASQEIFSILTKKPITPGEVEKDENPRSRSAKLRAAQRLTKKCESF